MRLAEMGPLLLDATRDPFLALSTREKMLIRITGCAYESRFNGGRERRERRGRNYFYPEFESKNGISLRKMSENWSDRE